VEIFAPGEHPIEPCILAASLHRHRHEDEHTYVLEGQIGVQGGGKVRSAWHGKLVFKPRNISYTFWNAGDAPARALVDHISYRGRAVLLEDRTGTFTIGSLGYEAPRLLCLGTG
jgi:hypothetical protein